MEKTKIREIKKIYSSKKINMTNPLSEDKNAQTKSFFEKIMIKLENNKYKY